MRTHPLRNMLVAMGLAVVLLVVTLAFGRSPTLGLDLQGGVSVNLQPVDESGEVLDDVSNESLDEAIGIIRNRVDAVGVTEPEVSRQGSTITVQLPGATDQQDVIDLVGTTARLRFRPVLGLLPPEPTEEERAELEQTAEELRTQLGLPEGVSAQDVLDEELAAAQAALEADPEGTSTPEGPQNSYGVDVQSSEFQELAAAETQLETQVTPRDEIEADQEVVLADSNGVLYRLGPTFSSGDRVLEGEAVEDATAGLDQSGQWVVNPVFKGGEDGIDLFNEAATACYNGDPQVCPAQQGTRGQLAIVLDGEVLTAPSINEATFARDQIQISGSFDQESAQAVAVALRYGSLPLNLEPQQAETVSATLGEGALQAGIIAGLIGLVAVFVYMFAYYRLLAAVSLVSLTTSALLLWSAMSWLGATVTLAGVVGLVVSIGVAIDSSVVSFEGIKEDVRNGSTVRSVAERSMTRSYSTIVKADTSSLIGAAVLYWLSVGPVRGFAFYLGAATLLDLFSAYFVLRPGVMALSRSGRGSSPKSLGIPIDDLADPVREKLTAAARGAVKEA
ncbi:MAG: protein translocase subunit SecD [Microthrixaceae bacterium]|nr:protein translocase subunit SecD [Microthrixaceae bacterium]MCO5319017.1 protein translocase subunit SecD [Microthrixaceae bacterium]